MRGPADRMREHVQQLSMVAAGRSQTLAGTVRLTASERVRTHVLPDLLRALRHRNPEIQIELVAINAVEKLLERDADIALHMLRPTHGKAMFALGCDTRSSFGRRCVQGRASASGCSVSRRCRRSSCGCWRNCRSRRCRCGSTAHRELRGTPRLKVVFDFLAEALAAR